MPQPLFISGIYLLGFSFGLAFKKRIPFPFICLTGFLWGCSIYVVGSLFSIGAGIPYNQVTVAGLFGLVLAGLTVVNVLLGNWRLQPNELAWLVGSFLAFFLASLAVSLFNFSAVSQDSYLQIMVGREIALDGFSPGVLDYLSVSGPFVMLLQSASVLIGSDYLYTILPSFSLSLLFAFTYLCFRSIPRKSFGTFFPFFFSLSAVLALFSSDMLFFQTFYIHNNLPSATYLFVLVAVCWLAVTENNPRWFVFAIPSLISFSLLRTETFMFAAFILVLVTSIYKVSSRVRWLISLPFLGTILLWYSLFYFRFSGKSPILNPTRIMLLIVFLILIAIYVYILRFRAFEHFIQSILLYGVSGGLILLLAGVFLFKTSNAVTNLDVIVQNMFITGRWGAFWYIILGCLILAFTQPRFTDEKFFILIILVYFVFLIVIGSIRTLPYHSDWFDSGNRMLTHIVPVVMYYLVVKYAPGYMQKVARFEAWLTEYKSSRLEAKP